MDRLTGGLGNDALYGNSGGGGDGATDTFVFTNNWGVDFVFDFETGIDKLDMTNVTGVHSASDLAITSNAGNALVSFSGRQIIVAGMAGQITASDFVFDAHAGTGTGEIDATFPFQDIIGSPFPVLLSSALDFGDDPYDNSDFGELTAGAQELISLPGSSSNVASKAFSYEVLNRTSGATLVQTRDEISYDTSPHKTVVDYTADISGTLFAVAVTRAFAFPAGTPVTPTAASTLLVRELGDLLIAHEQVSSADQWDRAILHVEAYDQQAADTVASEWANLDAAIRADTTVIITQTYGQDDFLYFV